ncbi:MAG: right-handed parallel beta-helix repeat-containing protein [bacterium]
MKKIISLVVFGMVLGIGSVARATTTVSGVISTDTTWTVAGSPYIVTGAVSVKGPGTPCLTMMPGVIVKFNQNIGLFIGGNGANEFGKLIANNATFTANQAIPTKGYWRTIYFYDKAEDSSTLNNCLIEYGGYGGWSNIHCYYASPIITNCTIGSSSNYGIYCTVDSFPDISGNTFINNNNYPITIVANSVRKVVNNNFPTNTTNAIEVLSDTINTSGTWTNQGVPYVIAGNVFVKGPGTPCLTIEPGVIVKFNQYTGLYIGGDGANDFGKLIANNATFTSNQAIPTKGYWYGIWFLDKAEDESTLNKCLIEYGGGYNYGNIYCENASPIITNSVIGSSSKSGIYCYNTSPTITNNTILANNSNGIHCIYSSPQVTNNTISGNTSYGIYCSYGSPQITNNTIRYNLSDAIYISSGVPDATSITGNTIEANMGYPISVPAGYVGCIGSNTYWVNFSNAIRVFGGDINTSAGWINQGIPYVIAGDVNVKSATSTLTILPNVEIRFATYTSLICYGNLIADGSLGTITFTSDQATHTAGCWGRILFYGGTSNLLKNVVVEYGGYDYGYNIRCYSGLSTITNSVIRNSSGHGIYCDSTAYITHNIITGNSSYGVFCSGYSNPAIGWNTITANKYGIYTNKDNQVITPNNISGNTDYGVYNATGNIYASNNWWGASDGPSGTGTGSGDAVNSKVMYIPWLRSPIEFGSILGTATYIGTQTGTFYVQAYTNPEFTGNPSAEGTASSPYQLTYLSPATYYVRAFLDTDNDHNFGEEPEANEPQNYYGTPTGIVVVSATNTFNIDITIKEKELPGSLSITSAPSGARIYLNTNDTGQWTNYVFTDLKPGTYTLKLTKEGYFDWLGTTTIESNQTTYVNATLTLNPATIIGTVTDKDTHLPMVGVNIRAIREGTTTISATATTSSTGTYTLSNLLYGTYTVYAQISDYATSSQSINLAPGDKKELKFELERKKIDIFLLKSAPQEEFAGQSINYLLIYGNLGNTEAEGVIIKDTLPQEVTYSNSTLIPSDVTQGTPTTLTWNIGQIGPYSTYTFTLYGTISAGIFASTTLTNYATITTTSTETTLTNNYASATTHIGTPTIDLVIKKYARASVNAGDEFIYQIVYDNYGQEEATGVVITDYLPAGVTYGSDTLGNADVDNGTITWQIDTLTPYSFGYFEVTVKVSADTSGTITNRIEISTSAPESDLSNNMATVTTKVREGVFDLWVSKIAPLSIPEENNITYRIHYGNYGNKSVGNVVLTDVLPAGVVYATDTLGGQNNNGTITWNLGTLTAGTSSFLELTVNVTSGSGTSLFNQIEITPADTKPSNNIATTTTKVIESSCNVWVAKNARDMVARGNEMLYSIFYGNSGNRPATNIIITDNLPGSITYISDNSGLTVSGTTTGNIIWQIGTLTPGTSNSFKLRVKVGDDILGSTTITNYATITTDSLDKDISNNYASATTLVLTPQPDVSIYKTVNKNEAIRGDTLEYTVYYYNNGIGRAEDVVITDYLPAESNYLSNTLGTPTIDNGTITWVITTLEPGTMNTFKLFAQVKDSATATLSNVAQITTQTPDDPLGNNSATVTVKIVEPKIDLSIRKEGPKEAIAGSEISYLISYQNLGNAPVSDVTITDVLPIKTGYVSDTLGGAQGTQTGTITWQIGTLSALEKKEFTLVVKIDPNTIGSSNITNSVQITGAGSETNTANNYASVTTHILDRIVDLVINKSGPTEINQLNKLEYTISYSNQGNVPATNVTITDYLPTGTTYLSDTSGFPVSGTSTRIITWQVGTLNPSATYTFTVTCWVESLPGSTTLVNLINILGAGTETNLANNQASCATHIKTPPPPPPPTEYDLEVTKTGPAEIVIDPTTDDYVEYVIVYQNLGLATALDVKIRDILPEGLIFFSAGGDFLTKQVDATDRNILFNIGNLGGGKGGKITVQAIPLLFTNLSGSETITNYVDIFPVKEDSNPGNNSSKYNSHIATPDVWIKKHGPAEITIIPDSPAYIDYVIEFGNKGEGLATDIEVSDFLNGEVSYSVANPLPNEFWGGCSY